MLRVAVCDDERKDLDEIVSLLKRYDSGGLLEITTFFAAKELLAASEKTPFDLAILDIEMEAPNGFEAAQMLLRQAKPPLIVFVTKSMAYTLRGYGVAFRYCQAAGGRAVSFCDGCCRPGASRQSLFVQR